MGSTLMKISSDHVMIFLLVCLVCAVVYSVVRQQRDTSSSFNLFDLLMHRGKLSHAYVFATGGWTVHTWLIVFWALREGKEGVAAITSNDMLIYSGIWVAPVMAWIIKGGAGDPPPPMTYTEKKDLTAGKENTSVDKS
jgi:hypothetical protein